MYERDFEINNDTEINVQKKTQSNLGLDRLLLYIYLLLEHALYKKQELKPVIWPYFHKLGVLLKWHLSIIKCISLTFRVQCDLSKHMHTVLGLGSLSPVFEQ